MYIGNCFHKKIAVGSPNFVQVGKGKDWKTLFSGWDIKKCRADGETLLMLNPVKKVFSDQNLSLW